MNRRAVFSLSLGLLCGLAATAQELTERRLLELFRNSRHHRDLQAGIQVARAEASLRTAYPNPSVSAMFEGAGRTDFLMFEQPLPINGRRRLLRRVGSAAVREEELRAEHAVREAEARLRVAFYRLAYGQRRQATAAASLEDLEELVRILCEREQAGEGARFDTLRAEKEIVERKVEAAEAQAMIEQERARLAGLLHENVRPESLTVRASLVPGFELPALAEALDAGLAARSDYTVEASRMERWSLEAEAADRLRVPNPKVVGGLKRAQVGGTFVNGPVVGVSVDLPLFAKGQAERAVAKARENRARAGRRLLESEILADIRAAHDALRIRRRIAQEYAQEAASRARELLGIADVAYEEGEIGILDLLEAHGTMHRTQLRELALRIAAKLAEVEFDRSVAKELH